MIKKKKKITPTPIVERPDDYLDEHQKKALEYMEKTNQNIFLTGRAGTGKSRLLQHFKEVSQKNVAVLAYTGVAALNIKGQTIHSFFGFGINITPGRIPTAEDPAIYKRLEAIIIDEISMVRADLLDCIDLFLRKNGPHTKQPFGGVQMIFIGDPFQLPPVVKQEERKMFEGFPYSSEYFFNSKVFEQGFTFVYIELSKIHRQQDEQFVRFLNSIREGSYTREKLAIINERHVKDFDENSENDYVHLVTTNQMARDINLRKLAQLKGKTKIFNAAIHGSWKSSDFPTDDPLELKVGAQVMLLNNDVEKRWVNGDIGKVTAIDTDAGLIEVNVVGSGKQSVMRHTWKHGSYSFNEDTKHVEYEESDATFTQFPLRLAWAMTIHKAQGKTFDDVVINFGSGTFSHGQAYVALSRCRTLERTILRRPVNAYDIKVDQRVIEFMKKVNNASI